MSQPVQRSARNPLVPLWGKPSRLMTYLPSLYADDPFLGSFLNIFDDTWQPLSQQIAVLWAYFDPRLTPPDMLPWLSTWVDLALDENWPVERRRQLILRAADLYRRRGTRSALRDYLAIYMDAEPEISEDAVDGNPYHFTVVFRLPDPSTIDPDRVRRIIEEEKPAHTTYTLRIEKA
ncbi:MAG: DUF2313 domain-containing protein [Chloroflexi bacterium]|nr:DUF2313 domain-containing protein [Chloroflexota bacterium]